MIRSLLFVFVLGLAFVIAFGSNAPVYAQSQSGPEVTCDPFLSGIASFVIPGWGQWLNGERSKAVTHIVVGLGLTAGSILLWPTTAALLAGLGRTAWGLYSTYDAFASCVRLYDDVNVLESP